MKGTGIILIYLLLSSPIFSQLTIKGKVVAATGKTPLPGSSVFISNTSKGTTADKDGYFELNNVPAGKHELIISNIGYETNVFTFSSEQLPLQVRVELQMKVKELQNVNVEPYLEEGWDKWGKTFLDNFIGSTANAKDCKIKNQESIRFRYFRKSNRLVAFSDKPVIIENKALGYRINFQLEDFEANFKEHTSIFMGYPLFEEIEKGGRGKQNKWKKGRDKAYYGSMMHFMRSVYTNTIDKEGFEVRRMIRRPNLEKERVKKIYREQRVVQSGNLGIRITTGNETAEKNADSANYYQQVMRQPDFIDEYGKDLLTADSIIAAVEGNYKVILFENYLHVTYKEELEEEGYPRFSGENRTPTSQRSYLVLMHGQAIAIDVNGSYFHTQELYSGGYWGWGEKIANFLPVDYKPE